MNEPRGYDMEDAERTYGLLREEREELQQLFSQEDERGDPLLVISEEGEKTVCPYVPEDRDQLRAPANAPASYDSVGHVLKAEASEIADESAGYVLRHELTHSVVGEDMNEIKIDSDVLKDFDGYCGFFGRYCQDAFRELGIDQASVGPKEFFPALGVAYLEGENPLSLNRWRDDFRKCERKAKHGDERDRLKLSMRLQERSRHLPQMAGEILVDQYDGDVEAALEDHPEILVADEEELWEEICVPLLSEGELS